MPEIRLQAMKSAYLPYLSPNSNDHIGSSATLSDDSDMLVVGFSAVDTSLKYRKISKVDLHIYGTTEVISDLYVGGIAADFSEASVSRNSLQRIGDRLARIAPVYANSTSEAWRTGELWLLGYPDGVRAALAHGVWIEVQGVDDIMQPQRITTSRGTNKPYLAVQYIDEDATVTVEKMAPAAGYVPKSFGSLFSWAFLQDGISAEKVEPTAVTFLWRSSAGATIHNIDCGTKSSVLVPAGTFETDAIQWSVTATLNTGATISSKWVDLSTKEEASTSMPISPVDIPIDGSVANRLKWKHIISTGTAQTKADLQFSADGTTWTSLATVTGSQEYYDLPAGSLASGTCYWRVRTYNTENLAGAWSSAAKIIVIAAPPTPIITISATSPRPTIIWASSGQQAYQVSIPDFFDSGTIWGLDTTWTAPFYFPDGDYTINVRVQNEYSLWSDWGVAALPIRNISGEAIVLRAAFSKSVELAWSTTGNYDFYIVERNGVPIVKTNDSRYSDYTAIGSTAYRVRGCYAANSNYGLSNELQVSAFPTTTSICNIETGEQLDLVYSTARTRTNGATQTSTISLIHVSGEAYPVAEKSAFIDFELNVSCAFRVEDRSSAVSLEAMVGKLVCVKTPSCDMAIGYLTSLQKTVDEFVAQYAFTIQHIAWTEMIDLDS